MSEFLKLLMITLWGIAGIAFYDWQLPHEGHWGFTSVYASVYCIGAPFAMGAICSFAAIDYYLGTK